MPIRPLSRAQMQRMRAEVLQDATLLPLDEVDYKGLRNIMTLSAVGDEKIYCPYCQTVSNFDFPFYSRTYYHCPSCDLIFLRRKEDVKTVIAYYQNLYFDDHTEDQMSGHRTNIYRHVLDVLEGYKNPGSLLDLGCGCGFFLKEARNRGWDITGIDPSEESITYCDRLLGVAVANKGTLKDLSKEKVYDVITMINVLDHSTEPWSEIERASILLTPGGLVFLRFPNGIFHPILYKISKIFKLENFIKKFLVFHEYSFTPKFIRRLLTDYGFSKIVIQNARFSGGTFSKRLFKKIVGIVVKLYVISAGSFTVGPSLEVTARKT